MFEAAEAHRRALYRSEREAFSEYQLFLETTPPCQKGTPDQTYLTELRDLQTKLRQVEAARKLFDEANPPCFSSRVMRSDSEPEHCDDGAELTGALGRGNVIW